MSLILQNSAGGDASLYLRAQHFSTRRAALVQEIVVRFVLIDKLDNFLSLACPESQHIKTNQQNILIRSLMLNDKNGDSGSKDVKAAAEGPRKRAAERVMDSRASAKKANTQGSSQPEGPSSRAAEKDYHCLTVERLRALLKERGLSSKGKKACSLVKLSWIAFLINGIKRSNR
ncbi:hypothetical protein GOBAR_DD19159 [Gossypium barbadense]|nr:hypothetical protein GOBAR_DD19159 [Gossypium barbadense]